MATTATLVWPDEIKIDEMEIAVASGIWRPYWPLRASCGL